MLHHREKLPLIGRVSWSANLRLEGGKKFLKQTLLAFAAIKTLEKHVGKVLKSSDTFSSGNKSRNYWMQTSKKWGKILEYCFMPPLLSMVRISGFRSMLFDIRILAL